MQNVSFRLPAQAGRQQCKRPRQTLLLIPVSTVPRSWLPVLHPQSRFYAWWALLMLVLDLAYTAILCPLSVAFSPRASLVSWVSALGSTSPGSC